MTSHDGNDAPQAPLLVDDTMQGVDDFPFESIDYDWLLRENKMVTCKQNGVVYFMGASNGWCRLFTLKARQYWIAQAMTHHRAPDWKIHFSIRLDHVPRAFNLIAQHYLHSGCQFGMKAMLTNGEWPSHMKGREITVYIYRYYDIAQCRTIREYVGKGLFIHHDIDDAREEQYRADNFMEFNSQHAASTPSNSHHPFHMFDLGKNDEEDVRFYARWIGEVERILLDNGIETNDGCADGDLPIGTYSSLRNEAFVPCAHLRPQTRDIDERFIYPPNDAGWNAAGHDCSSMREGGICRSGSSPAAWHGLKLLVFFGALVMSDMM